MHNGSRAFPQQMQRLSGSAGSQRHDQCGQQRAHDHECADDLPSLVFTLAHGEAVNPSVMRSMRTEVLPA
jgi:hypothetical protein